MARLAFDALLYPDHPYGRSVRGYADTVATLSRDDVLQHYRETYAPEGLVVAVVGAVSASAAVDQVRAALGNWQAPKARPDRSVPPAVSLDATRQESVAIKGKTQTDLILGWPAIARDDPDYVRANLANTILGVFGMMGRLGDTVRDRQGLAYYVYSRLEAGLGAGPWFTVAGVNPAHVQQAIDGIRGEVRRLREELVPAEELADSQSFLTGSMPLRLETNEGLASTILSMERYQLGLDYLLHYADMVRAVDGQDVRDVANQYLDPDVYALATAGPEEES
jgi:zinc protease